MGQAQATALPPGTARLGAVLRLAGLDVGGSIQVPSLRSPCVKYARIALFALSAIVLLGVLYLVASAPLPAGYDVQHHH